MSERDSPGLGWKLTIVALVVMVILLSLGMEQRFDEIRDLQRRVGQLEEQVRR